MPTQCLVLSLGPEHVKIPWWILSLSGSKTKSHEATSPVFSSAGSDEEYIYMNKVSVNREQNSASPHEGTRPERLLGCLAPGRGSTSLPHPPHLPPGQLRQAQGFIFGMRILVNGILGSYIFGCFNEATTFLPIGQGICP